MLDTYTLTTEESARRDRQIEEQIAAMARGDVSGLGGLYELIRADVYAYALSKTGNRADAEDITHDTFVRIWQNAAAYTPQGKPMAWILTVELNLIRRAAGAGQKTVPLDTSVNRENGEDVSEAAIRNEFLREIMRVLTEEEREAVILHAVSGLKHREIAAMLGVPLSTVLSRYSRAIRKLQTIAKEGE